MPLIFEWECRNSNIGKNKRRYPRSFSLKMRVENVIISSEVIYREE